MPPRRRSTRSAGDLHRAWLELVDTEGPFLAVPVLTGVWPQGMPQLEDKPKNALTAAKPAFDAAWDAWDRNPADPDTLQRYRAARDEWLQTIWDDVLGWGEKWSPADTAITAATVTSPDGQVTCTPTGVVRHGDRVGLLVWVIDPAPSLREAPLDGWAENPVDRMELMLREADLPLGLVTDGRWWGLVSAPPKTLAASGVVDAQTWVEEPEVRNAVLELLRLRYLVGGAASERLPELFTKSVLAAEEITEALGVQVRQAVELVVAAFDEAAADARNRGEDDPLPDDGDAIYEAVVTVLMRVVFLLFAEERGLLPAGSLYAMGYGLSDQLDELTARAQDEGESSLDATHLTWHRLLATSQALYAGATFEDMRLPAYGGSLFDPARFPFLTATTTRGTLALTVSDRVMLKVLQAVQTAAVKGQDARRISFRDIDVEQIGYIYEGLLGYTCRRTDAVMLGLIGSPGNEPEIPLDILNDLYEAHGSDTATAAAIIEWAKKDQPAAKPPTANRLAKALASSDDVEDADLALRHVTRDEQLREELRPWIGVIRRDLRDRPVVAEPGAWLVEETPSRRNAGAHYTPRALAEEVVLHALEPIVYSPGPYQTPDRDSWRLKTSTEILDLKVADIACGSGAFLVAAARYLAARLVEAWQHEGTTGGMTPHEVETKALREVVAHCLYGADINAMAVEMCKLSLWLVSLDPALPFSFVDDKILHGNSLLGLTDLRQLEALHINPPTKPVQAKFDIRDNELVERLDIDHRIQRAISLRRQLATEIDEHDPQRTAAAKRAQMKQLQDVTAELRLVADGIVAVGLPLGGKPGKKLDEAYENLRIAVGKSLPLHPDTVERTSLGAIITHALTPTVETDYERWKPLHWCLEIPDVMGRGGFDAVIGNPPFLGGKKLSGAVGTNVREWLVNQLAEGAKGNADLVAYFLLRAASVLHSNGVMGLLGTNTIAQGDTREVGLHRLVHDGFQITRSVQSRPWPAATANLEFAALWGTKGTVSKYSHRISDGNRAARISPLLEPEGRTTGAPVRLAENKSIAFQGCIVLGLGFVLEPSEAADLIGRDSRNSCVVRPYLTGEDLNSRPDCSASRWVIDFDELSEISARSYVEPWRRVENKVKPTRIQKDALRYPRMVNEWWKFWNSRPALREALKDKDEVLAISLVSKTVMPVRVGTDQVFSHRVAVFTSDDFWLQAVLSSSIHWVWAVTYSSTLESRVNYSPSDCFLTFPLPTSTPRMRNMGRQLHEQRKDIMVRRQIGITKLYNLVSDPNLPVSADLDVARMREIHEELDHVVMGAYGWNDVALDHGFHTYRQMTRWTVSPAARVEILDRLLEENHRRAALQGDTAMTPDEHEDEVAE